VKFTKENPFGLDFNVVNWWEARKEQYPILYRMALEVLAIPATSVAMESGFSISKWILNDKRFKLRPKRFGNLVIIAVNGPEVFDDEETLIMIE
jgi:hypothetical protein